MAEDKFKDSVDKLESRKELPEGPETKVLPQHEEEIMGALPPGENAKTAGAAGAAVAAGVAAAGAVGAAGSRHHAHKKSRPAPSTTDAQEASGIMKNGVWAVVALAVVALGALLYYGRHSIPDDYHPRVALMDDSRAGQAAGGQLLSPSSGGEDMDVSGIMDGQPVDASQVYAFASQTASGQPAMVVVYLFDYDKSGVEENAKLTGVANQAVKDGSNVVVNAYTDEHGSVAYNKKLSARRANAIRDYMVKHGVPASHVKANGMGPTHAYAGGDSQNRRAEISLQK